MTRFKCPCCLNRGKDPHCVCCGKAIRPSKPKPRLTLVDERKQEIEEERERVNTADAERMLRNMRKVGADTNNTFPEQLLK